MGVVWGGVTHARTRLTAPMLRSHLHTCTRATRQMDVRPARERERERRKKDRENDWICGAELHQFITTMGENTCIKVNQLPIDRALLNLHESNVTRRRSVVSGCSSLGLFHCRSPSSLWDRWSVPSPWWCLSHPFIHPPLSLLPQPALDFGLTLFTPVCSGLVFSFRVSRLLI